MADTHLGFRQYNIDERFKDFNRAFQQVLQLALVQDVDFILLAGDVFDNSKITPDTMAAIHQMITAFQKTCQTEKNREIPIITIEGNHDLSGTHDNLRSWLQFLNNLGLIILLQEDYDNDKKSLKFPLYSSVTREGGLVRIKDACVYGMRSYGSVTSKFFPLISQAIPEDPTTFNILMMHFGIQGQDKNKFGLEISAELQNIHNSVDYLALGHFHKQYALPRENPWIYNPGSTEITDISQVFEPNYTHGIFLAEIRSKDPALNIITPILCSDKGISDEFYQLPNRAFYTYQILLHPEKVPTFQDVTGSVLEYLKNMGHKPKDLKKPPDLSDRTIPILIITLVGTISFSKFEINLKDLEQAIKEAFEVLVAKVYSRIESEIDGIRISREERISLQEIEQEVFTLMIEKDPNYAPVKSEIVGLIQEFKQTLAVPKPNGELLKDRIVDWVTTHLEDQLIHSEHPSPTTFSFLSDDNNTDDSGDPDDLSEDIQSSDEPMGEILIDDGEDDDF
jgi:DNA repair exonuclease SbcCD nuclease subunit